MRFFFVFLVTIWLIKRIRSDSDINKDYYLKTWAEYKKQFNKKYSTNTGRDIVDDSSSQENLRFTIFKQNLVQIKQHNSLNLTFKMGLNKFSDLTETELKSKFNRQIDLNQVKSNIKKATIIKSINTVRRIVPSNVNWIKNGVVTTPREQGNCGACYAFASVCFILFFVLKLIFKFLVILKAASIESLYGIKYNLKNNKLKKFSEQQIVDCSYYSYYNATTQTYANLGCDGGYLYYSFYYILKQGLGLLSSYPFVGSPKSCKYNSSLAVAKITSINTASYQVGDYEAMKQIVAIQPITTHMYVASDFYGYQSGSKLFYKFNFQLKNVFFFISI